MRIRGLLGVLLLSSLVPSPAHGQSPPSLQVAERALSDALLHHDGSAFGNMLTSDAVFFLPKETHGPEAIVRAWLPFLVDSSVTMVLTSDEAIVAKSGELAHSSGTYAIKGPTNNGVTTIPAGAYSAVWRLVDGSWKVASLAGSGNGSVRLVERGGVGGFRFGMTRTEVSGVSDCRPYTNVARTAGLECANYRFEGRTMNISFLFAGDQLRRIQLWFYEGDSDMDAREAVGRVIDYLQRTAGGVVIGGLPGTEVTSDLVMNMLNSSPLKPGSVAQLELSTPSGSQPQVWFSRVVRHQLGYFVLLFVDPLEGR